MAETINLGIVGIKNMGEYNSQTAYEKLNVVTYEGSTYCALKDTVGNLPTNTDYWQLYAQKGGTGDTGATGPQGDTGPRGIPGAPGGVPLVASSTSEMTDTDSVYVNTTDGYWYYYDGDSWEKGGLYQASSDYENVKALNETVFNTVYAINDNDDIAVRFGHLTSSGTIENNNNKNICFKQKVFAGKGSTISVDAGYKYEFCLYNPTTGAFIERITWKTSSDLYTLEDNYQINIEISDENETIQEDFSIYEHLHFNLVTKNTLNFIYGKNINTAGNVGDTIDLTPNDAPQYRYCIVDCKHNDVFKINAIGGYNPRVWCFIDSNNKILSIASLSTAEVRQINLMIVAPENAAKLIINDYDINNPRLCYALDNIESNRYVINQYKDIVEDIVEDINNIESEIVNNTDYQDAINQCGNIVAGVGENTFIGKQLTIQPPNEYRCWPFIGKIQDKLICFYSHGTSHEGSVFDVVYRYSWNGVLWSKENVLFHQDNTRENITGKGYDGNGNLLIWRRTGQPGSQSTKFSLYRTSNGTNYTLVSQPTFDVVCGHIGDIINIPNTNNLICFFNTYGATRSWGVLKSADNGVNWEQIVIESDLSQTDCPVEISGVYLGDNKILAMGRKDNTQGTNAMFQIQSSDMGVTWSKQYTNITDIAISTPSILLQNNNLYLYYFQREAGNLRLRINPVSSVWNNPTNWNASTIIGHGTTSGEDTGNVNACQFNDRQIATFYSGNSTDTGIYSVME